MCGDAQASPEVENLGPTQDHKERQKGLASLPAPTSAQSSTSHDFYQTPELPRQALTELSQNRKDASMNLLVLIKTKY